jgi:hypothetical protein
LSLALALVALGLPLRDNGVVPQRDATWFLPATAAVLPFLLEVLQRWIVRRPQPLVEPDLLAADDAIRSQSVHSICGSGMAIQLLLIAETCLILDTRALPGVIRTVVVLPATFGYLAALGCCLYFGHRAWRVPRRHAAVSS